MCPSHCRKWSASRPPIFVNYKGRFADRVGRSTLGHGAQELPWIRVRLEGECQLHPVIAVGAMEFHQIAHNIQRHRAFVVRRQLPSSPCALERG